MAVSRLARFGYARPRVFVATVPGGSGVRLAVERYAREHGWPLAASPADTDVLAVCGDPGTGWIADAVEMVGRQIPAPRARVDLPGTDVEAALTRAREELFDLAAQRAAAPVIDADGTKHSGNGRPGSAEGAEEHTEHGDHDAHEMHADHGSTDEHAGHGEHAEHEVHGGHAGQGDHAGHAMHSGHGDHAGHMGHGGEVAGLPMADRAPDRDELALDQLEVTFGPFLPCWPAGLRLRVALQGDVAATVVVDQVSDRVDVFAGSPAAERLDALASLLDVCGADGWTVRARRLRDELLAGVDRSRAVTRFARRLRRSRLVRGCTDGVATVGGRDATTRWHAWLDEAESALSGAAASPMPSITPEDLGAVLEGHELGGLRIAVASLVPPTGFATAREPVVV